MCTHTHTQTNWLCRFIQGLDECHTHSEIRDWFHLLLSIDHTHLNGIVFSHECWRAMLQSDVDARWVGLNAEIEDILNEYPLLNTYQVGLFFMRFLSLSGIEQNVPK